MPLHRVSRHRQSSFGRRKTDGRQSYLTSSGSIRSDAQPCYCFPRKVLRIKSRKTFHISANPEMGFARVCGLTRETFASAFGNRWPPGDEVPIARDELNSA